MRTTLRSFFLAAAVLATVAFTTRTAAAATVRVPFNFNVDGKVLPAGTYNVTHNLNDELVTLESQDCKYAYSWLVMRDYSPNQPEHKVTLRFDESGGNYALRNVQFDTLVTKRLDKHYFEKSTLRSVVGQ
jgi:hypothetical protein